MMWNGNNIEACKPGVSPFFNLAFQNTSDPVKAGQDSYNFGCIENIPGCLKYRFPTDEIDFRVAPTCHSMPHIGLMIWDVIALLPYEDRFHLNAARWDFVKRDLSEGWCYSPWVTVDGNTGKPALMDGRHRMTALLKFTGHTHIPFAVEADHMEIVKAYFKV